MNQSFQVKLGEDFGLMFGVHNSLQHVTLAAEPGRKGRLKQPVLYSLT